VNGNDLNKVFPKEKWFLVNKQITTEKAAAEKSPQLQRADYE
jgi:hypothetical protein